MEDMLSDCVRSPGFFQVFGLSSISSNEPRHHQPPYNRTDEANCCTRILY